MIFNSIFKWLIISILFFFSCANNKNQKKGDSLSKEAFIYLSSYGLEYDTLLNGGSYLSCRKSKDSISDDSIQVLYLVDSKSEVEIASTSLGLPFKNLGYIANEFNDCFLFVRSFGGGNPYSFSLITKEKGDILEKGFLVDVSFSKKYFIFRNYDDELNGGKFYIYNINKKTSKQIELPDNINQDCMEDYKCFHITGSDSYVANLIYYNLDNEIDSISISIR